MWARLEDQADPPRLPKRKRILFSAVPGLFVCLMALLAGEILLRTRYRKIEEITGATDWETVTYVWDCFHPVYGWTNLPGFRSDDRVPFEVTINGQGLRSDHDYPPTPEPGTKRIAILGDSYIFGEEVDDDDTLTAQLERRWEGVEVLNFGVHGHGLGQMVLRLEEEVFAFHPDHVVIALLVPYDVQRDPLDSFVHTKPAFTSEGGSLRVTNVPVPPASEQGWLLRHSFVAAWLLARQTRVPEPETTEGLVRTTRLLLRRAQAGCKAKGVPLTLVVIVGSMTAGRTKSDEAFLALTGCLRDSVAGMGLDVLDLVEFERRASAEHGGAITEKLGHWSPLGNALVGEEIGRHLAGRNPGLPPF